MEKQIFIFYVARCEKRKEMIMHLLPSEEKMRILHGLDGSPEKMSSKGVLGAEGQGWGTGATVIA